jgi:hypothetical protein
MRQHFILLTIVLFLLTPSLVTAGDYRPDSILSTKTITGYFIGFQTGDYSHAIISTENGTFIDFFPSYKDICFLVSNRDSLLTIQYTNITHYFPEYQEFHPVNIINKIKTKEFNSETWIKKAIKLKKDFCIDIASK